MFVTYFLYTCMLLRGQRKHWCADQSEIARVSVNLKMDAFLGIGNHSKNQFWAAIYHSGKIIISTFLENVPGNSTLFKVADVIKINLSNRDPNHHC